MCLHNYWLRAWLANVWWYFNRSIEVAALEKTSLTTPVALGRVLGAKRKFTDGAKVKDVQKKKRAKNVNDSRSYKFSYSSYIFNSVKHTFFLSCLVSSGISCVCQVIDTTNLLSILVSINLKSAEISGFHSYHKFHHLYCNFTNSQKKPWTTPQSSQKKSVKSLLCGRQESDLKCMTQKTRRKTQNSFAAEACKNNKLNKSRSWLSDKQ